MSQSFNITCYYPAEKPQFFQVEIDLKWIVSRLVKEIRLELRSEFNVEIAHDIQLFKVCITTQPREDRRFRALQWLHQQRGECLDDGDLLSSVFSTVPTSGSINIIVSDPEVSEMIDGLGDPVLLQQKKLRKDLGKRMDNLRLDYSPSDIIVSAAKMRAVLEGDHTGFHIGRPSGAPPAIFSPALAALQKRLENLDDIEVSCLEVSKAAKYSADAIKFYSDDAERQAAVSESLDEAIGQKGNWGMVLPWVDRIKPDCSWWHNDFLMMVLELKNAMDITGNPALQSALVFSKIISQEKYKSFREFCNFPIVLIGVAENRIDIYIGVCIGDIHVAKLLTLDVIYGFLASDNIVRLARVFAALSHCREDLAKYYDDVNNRKTTKLSSFFPNPTPVDPCQPLPTVVYKHFTARNGQPASVVGLGAATTLLYIATLDDKEVIVKFTVRYNEKAHRILATAGLAPELHFCGRIVGGLYMVVMDRICGKFLWQLNQEKTPVPSFIVDQVEQAVHLLHAENIVFGDLRDNNIIYDASKERAVLIDFDWPGMHGKTRYPATLNTTGKWADGVVQYAVMDKDHDLWQLDRLRDSCTLV
ncbi:hypothetical protein BDN70DRAFT_917313 [Pholiota conissans]|uniref:Crinkler effector protein N-terminal domain-containing protein n=1 Tax=Pholiota conissans TaxID=109636 RepID=A0A9P6D6Q7_9AGAR|nr:hypothetical protein BDN70DRAFT_917313 [Pholiota conissans]